MTSTQSGCRLILVGGGVRSGKSQFALARAAALPATRRLFVATAQALDEEMARRIRQHRVERDPAFETVEEPLELARVVAALNDSVDNVAESPGGARAEAPVLVIDCLTLWVSNLMMQHREGQPDVDVSLARAFTELERALVRRRAHVILVTNEVGMGVVPESALGRAFRDAVGRLHQRLAGMADEIYAAMMGVVLRLHPAPVAVVHPISDQTVIGETASRQ